MDNVDGIVREALADFKGYIANTKANQAPLLATLTAEVEAVGMDKLDDYFSDVIDETRGHIAARAANRIESPSGQEDAIGQIEDWFSSNISDQGAEDAVVCAIWGYGAEQATTDIRNEIAKVSVPSVPQM